MWDTLQAGEPFCAYVDDMAADGSTYGVFATVTPLGEDYLSVRCRPFVDGLHDAAFAIYGTVRPMELELQDRGANPHDAAEHVKENDAEGRLSSAMLYLRVWAQVAPEVGGIVSGLLTELDELRRSCVQTRLRFASAN